MGLLASVKIDSILITPYHAREVTRHAARPGRDARALPLPYTSLTMELLLETPHNEINLAATAAP
jgi:hypothetical protein